MRKKAALYTPALAAVILILLLSLTPYASREQSGDNAYITSIIIQLFVYLLPCAFFCKLRNINVFSGMRLRFSKTRNIPFIIIASLFFIIASDALRYLLYYFYETGYELPVLLENAASKSTAENLLISLCFIIVPAVLEELVFRGVILYEYRFSGTFLSIFVSSLFFAMIHFSLQEFVLYFFAGAVLALITVVCDSIIPAIILHIINNYTSIYLNNRFFNFLSEASDPLILLFILSALSLLLLFFMLARMEKIFLYKAEDIQQKSEKKKQLIELEKNRIGKRQRIVREACAARPAFLKRLAEIAISPAFIIACAVFLIASLGLFN